MSQSLYQMFNIPSTTADLHPAAICDLQRACHPDEFAAIKRALTAREPHLMEWVHHVERFSARYYEACDVHGHRPYKLVEMSDALARYLWRTTMHQRPSSHSAVSIFTTAAVVHIDRKSVV